MSAEWARLLDRFEQDLDPEAAATAWTAPDSALPADMIARAQQVHARQEERMRQLRAALADTRAQQEALARIPAPSTDTPGFLDISA